MVVESTNRSRYRARAARRPLLFWWQAFVLLAGMVLLWSQLPIAAVLFEPRAVPVLSDAHAAYVELNPQYAAQAFKKSLTAWTSGGSGGKTANGMELGTIDLGTSLKPPEFLQQGLRYPGAWQPLPVSELPVRLSEVPFASAQAEPGETQKAPPAFQGVRAELDRGLKAASFVFSVTNDAALLGRSGHCRFYLETEKDGAVAHLLLLTPRTPAAAAFELQLLRGRASGAARGMIDLYWMYPKP